MSFARASVLVAAALVASGCAGLQRWPFGTTQRVPGPMEATVDPLPPGDVSLIPPGPEEVLVVRHADPVQVRPAGLASAFPLAFYNKSVRVRSGSAVYSAPGGRIEVLWPNGSSVVISGRGAGVIGSRSRGEPAFVFRELERAVVQLESEDEIELLGGARLSARSGPYILEHQRADILRVKNQSKLPGRVAFRDAFFDLDPGQVVDLPLLSSGGQPYASDPGLVDLAGPGFPLQYAGALDVDARADGVTLRALSSDHEVRALGQRVRVQPGETVEVGPLRGGGDR